MKGVYIEQRILHKSVALSWDIAHHLYTRQFLGGFVVVIVANPPIMLASVKKQWLKVIEKLKRERSRTLVSQRSKELERTAANMEIMQFVLLSNVAGLKKGIIFIRPEEMDDLHIKSHTIYITCTTDVYAPEYLLTERGLIVEYKARMH